VNGNDRATPYFESNVTAVNLDSPFPRFDMKVVNFGTRQVQQSEEIISPRVIRGRMIETIAEAGPDDDEQSTR
jgi:hypothetical protein